MAGAIDLNMSAELKRDEQRALRMTAVSMVLDMHSRGIPVVDVEDASGKALSGPKVLANMYDACKKWTAYIESGQAIGS